MFHSPDASSYRHDGYEYKWCKDRDPGMAMVLEFVCSQHLKHEQEEVQPQGDEERSVLNVRLSLQPDTKEKIIQCISFTNVSCILQTTQPEKMATSEEKFQYLSVIMEGIDIIANI